MGPKHPTTALPLPHNCAQQIVIYIIVQASSIEPSITDCDLMLLEGLIDPESNRSEPGYYLAVFHAAAQWIRAYNPGRG